MDSVLNFFRSVYAFIRNQLSVTVIIYLCIAILVLILIWIIMRMIKRKKASKRLSDLEMNEIRNNSLAYKFNKASAFARVNDDIMDKVKNLTPKYDTCQKNLSACDDLFNEADDYVSRHRLRKSMRAMDDLETMMDETKERIRIVTQSLDHILARETEVRESANALKERFRNVKTVYQDNRSSFYGSVNYVDSCLEEIENEFSNFEEWMFASEFNKAKEEQEKISKMVDEISSKIAAFPGLYEKAKNVLPRAINEVRLHIKELQEKDIDTLILGCTHYPLLRSTIGQIMGDGVTLVNPAYETALELGRLLKEQDMQSSGQGQSDFPYRFYVSDLAEKFKGFANSILPFDVEKTQKIDIEKY